MGSTKVLVCLQVKDDQGKLTFLSLTNDEQSVMMVSSAFLKADLPDSVVKHLGASYLYHR